MRDDFPHVFSSLAFTQSSHGVIPLSSVNRRYIGVAAVSVGKRLRALMLELNLGTIDDFAKLLGAERSAVSGWVNGYNLPRIPSMARLMALHPGLTLDWIYLGVPDGLPMRLATRLQVL